MKGMTVEGKSSYQPSKDPRKRPPPPSEGLRSPNTAKNVWSSETLRRRERERREDLWRFGRKKSSQSFYLSHALPGSRPPLSPSSQLFLIRSSLSWARVYSKETDKHFSFLSIRALFPFFFSVYYSDPIEITVKKR